MTSDQRTPLDPALVPVTALHDGTAIAQLGYGVWQIPDDEAEPAVLEALRLGYRHIDTAAIYGNESGVGRGVAASGVPRDEIAIVTKVWNGEQGYDSTLRAYDASLRRLGLDKVDIYLIHWAAPPLGTYVETWKALVTLHNEGRVRSIGVSNFHQPHLTEIIDATGVVPVINQVELHPYLQQEELRAFHRAHGIATEAWSPLGQGKGLLDDPVLGEIAAARGITPAQVVLAWHLANDIVAIPKSATPSRIAENLASVAVRLADDELAAITALDRGRRYGGNPDTADWT